MSPCLSKNERSFENEMLTSEQFDRFYRSLGLLIRQFTDVENMVLWQLRIDSKLSLKDGAVVFENTNADKAIQLLRQLCEVRNVPIREDLDRSLTQLTKIKTFRNDIVHYGISFTSSSLQIDNSIRKVSKPRSYLLRIEDIEDAIADLNTIKACFGVSLIEGKIETEVSGLSDLARAEWRFRHKLGS